MRWPSWCTLPLSRRCMPRVGPDLANPLSGGSRRGFEPVFTEDSRGERPGMPAIQSLGGGTQSWPTDLTDRLYPRPDRRHLRGCLRNVLRQALRPASEWAALRDFTGDPPVTSKHTRSRRDRLWRSLWLARTKGADPRPTLPK
jgi:hypothetical protein